MRTVLIAAMTAIAGLASQAAEKSIEPKQARSLPIAAAPVTASITYK